MGVKGTCAALFMLLATAVSAQTDLVYVKLDSWAKDDRFEKMINPVAFYYTESDTIFSFDVENLKEPVPVIIKRPAGYKSYAYGYVFFTGIPNKESAGMMNLLLVNVKEKQPKLFTDRNNNKDFTDDGEPLLLPHGYKLDEQVLLELKRADNKDAGIAVLLSRINFTNKYAYKNMLNEYYEFFYKDRRFVGIDYSFREQRYVARSGIFRTDNDSFSIALFDANSNGLYNDPDTDKVIIGNYGDSVFDAKDELHSFTISKRAADQYVERNGEQYEMLQTDPAGKFVVLKKADSAQLFDKIPVGKKVPKFTVVDWNGDRYKIRKFRKKQVYVYYTGPHTKNFTSDTIALRKIAGRFGDRVAVIAFMDVDKSYELKIFGTYSNLNWIAAFKDKYVIRDLKLRGLPASLLLGKKRKVKRYNITPQQLLTELEQESR